MRGKIMIPMYRLWLHGLYGLYVHRWSQSPERPLNLISHSLPLLRGPLTTGIVASQCTSSRNACDALTLLHTFNISMFKSVKKNFATIKYIYNKFANIIEGHTVAFDTNDCWNFQKRWPWSALWCARLRYTWAYLMPGICLINPTAMDKLMPFPTKFYAVMLSGYDLTFCHFAYLMKLFETNIEN